MARTAIAGAGFSVLELTHVPEGRAHTVFRVGTSDGVFYAKVSGSPRPRFVNEANALRALRGRIEGVPELVTCDSNVLLTRSIGEDLRAIRADDVDAWAEFGNWLTYLHDMDGSGMAIRYDTDPLPLRERLATTAIRAAERLNRTVPDLNENCAKLRGLPTTRAFVHRDLRWDNILVRRKDGTFAGVVDFEHAAVAVPAWDLVKPLSWKEPHEDAVSAFLAGYGSAPDTEIFAWFEAVTVAAYMPDRSEYLSWAEKILDES